MACVLCGCPEAPIVFYPGASLREARCPVCHASRRTRDLGAALLRAVSGDPSLSLARQLSLFRRLRIFELQAQGPLHSLLKGLPGYVCSEYFPDIPPGGRNELGVLCQDAERLTFADGSFDIVISQDIMEHVNDPWRAFAEIHRTLRPGGRHIFTVPLHEGRLTRRRAERAGDAVRHALPPVFHKDPLNQEGALVFWDFGGDLPDLLGGLGIPAERVGYTALYNPDELCAVDTEVDYRNYLKAREANRIASFFLYNSVVFSARRLGMTPPSPPIWERKV